MKLLPQFVLITAIISAAHLPIAGAAKDSLSAVLYNSKPLQGDAVIIAFPGNNLQVNSTTFNGQPVPFFSYHNSWRAVFGIPVTQKPGSYLFKLNFADGSVFEKTINVRARHFPVFALGVPEKLNLTPSGLVSQLQNSNSSLKAVSAILTSPVFFNQTFGLPLVDNRKVSSYFGEIRKTGNKLIRHLGVDFDATTGAAVAAINSGIVRRAYLDQIYGNTIVIDHGQSIYSLYLHLNDVKVKEGDLVKRGQILGHVGQTGYTTSPHLHLSIKIANVPVDPLKFVNIFK